jgi:hypothetical protein
MGKALEKATIGEKLAKVNDSFTVNMYDNGFMFEISGRDSADDWKSAKIVVNTIDDLVDLINEAQTLPRD